MSDEDVSHNVVSGHRPLRMVHSSRHQLATLEPTASLTDELRPQNTDHPLLSTVTT